MIAILLALGLHFTVIDAQVTAYAPFDNQSGICANEDPTRTSTGVRPGPEYLAADPRRLPYGSIVYIPSHGITKVADTGGALRRFDGVAVDVYKDTYAEAIEWGKKDMKIIVIGRIE
jgi:3D (Asp-Asp-Asp) domain-containing protein